MGIRAIVIVVADDRGRPAIEKPVVGTVVNDGLTTLVVTIRRNLDGLADFYIASLLCCDPFRTRLSVMVSRPV